MSLLCRLKFNIIINWKYIKKNYQKVFSLVNSSHIPSLEKFFQVIIVNVLFRRLLPLGVLRVKVSNHPEYNLDCVDTFARTHTWPPTFSIPTHFFFIFQPCKCLQQYVEFIRYWFCGHACPLLTDYLGVSPTYYNKQVFPYTLIS